MVAFWVLAGQCEAVPAGCQLGRGLLCCWAYWVLAALIKSVVELRCCSERFMNGTWVSARVHSV